ncbi:MAG: methionine adenosyltransferase [Bacilli bacterium]|nr:methionine adenosyltransferase [Bacilli bacterium]
MEIKTSEAVFKGHPDKVCDQIADGLLDVLLSHDKDSRVAIECLIKDNFVIVAGEVTSSFEIDYANETRRILDDIGYTDAFEIIVKVSEQSNDIKVGVDNLGAGDQGIMYGYATDETKEYLPLPYVLSRNIAKRMDEINRHNPSIFGLDGKCQVSIVYEGDKARHISTVVVSAQTKPGISREEYEPYILEVLEEVLPSDLTDTSTLILINPTGEFVTGGPNSDSGVTGRKLQVDSYGTLTRHGGGAYSGKDYTKVDRSGAYFARYVAKAVVKANLATSCHVSVAYAIGVPFPVMVDVKAKNSEFSNDELRKIINKVFDFAPSNIIKELKLKEQRYQALSTYGHFGNKDYPWEEVSEEVISRLKEASNSLNGQN